MSVRMTDRNLYTDGALPSLLNTETVYESVSAGTGTHQFDKDTQSFSAGGDQSYLAVENGMRSYRFLPGATVFPWTIETANITAAPGIDFSSANILVSAKESTAVVAVDVIPDSVDSDIVDADDGQMFTLTSNDVGWWSERDDFVYFGPPRLVTEFHVATAPKRSRAVRVRLRNAPTTSLDSVDVVGVTFEGVVLPGHGGRHG